MARNLGTLDRVIRGVVGTMIAVTPLLWTQTIDVFDWALAAAGLSLVLTAVFGVCPIYWLVGLKTCR